jgi:thiamine-monophosphate kinase
MRGRRKSLAISEIGELGFLDRLLPDLKSGRGVIVGPGDDCAVVRVGTKSLLVTTDALIEDVHYRRGWISPRQIGRKAYLVNASDIAAMGGRPRFCVVATAAPKSFPSADLTAVHRGVAAAAAETGAVLVGGNLARAEQLSISVTLLGEAPARPLRRCGARPGDLLCVTGTLGEAALGLLILQRGERAAGVPLRRFREPQPRLRAGQLLARHRLASAAIDISDGLLQDLGHLCAASRVGARIEAARLPTSRRVGRRRPALALNGGEDYELLCAVPERNWKRVERLQAKLGCRVTPIGRCTAPGSGIRVFDEGGRALAISPGFDHFAEATSA